MPTNGPPTSILDAAYDLLSCASLRAQDPDRDHDGDRTLAGLLSIAAGHGLTVTQLCDATGLDQAYVTDLLERAELGRAG